MASEWVQGREGGREIGIVGGEEAGGQIIDIGDGSKHGMKRGVGPWSAIEGVSGIRFVHDEEGNVNGESGHSGKLTRQMG